MSQTEARKHAAAGDWPKAVAAMRSAIAQRPGVPELWRQLLPMVERLNNPPMLHAALADWAAADRWCGGLEAEERLMLLEGRGLSVGARARHLIRRYRVGERERRLRRASAPLAERLDFLMHRGLADECGALLRATPLGDKMALDPAVLRRLLHFHIANHRPERLVPDLCEGDVARLGRRQGIIVTLAQALARAGHIPEAEAALAQVPKDGPHRRMHLAVEHLIATRLNDPNRQRATLEAWAAEFPDDPAVASALLQARIRAGDYAAALSQIEDTGFGRFGSPGALDLAQDMIDAGKLDDAFRLLTLAADHWPDNLLIDERLTAVAHAVGEVERAREARLRRVLIEELDADLIAMAGADDLLAGGGRQAVHHAVLDAIAEPGDPRGILDLARLLLASLRIVTTIRTGERREAKELAPYGAADWAARKPDAARLAGLIRGLCAVALKAAPDDPAVPRLLLDLQLMIGDGGKLTETLVRSMTAEALPRTALAERLWIAGLSCDAPELWAELAAIDAERGVTSQVMRFAPMPPEGAVLRHGGAALSKPVGVTGPLLTAQIQLSLPTVDEYRSGPRAVDLWGGYLASLADTDGDRTVLNLVSNGYIAHQTDRVRHIGALAVAVDPAGEPLIIEHPTVFVPGVRVHYRNYYHFTGQMLPRLLALRAEAVAETGNPVAIVLPDFAAGFVTSVLTLCGVAEDEILRVPANRPVRLERCIIASPTMHDWQCAPSDLSGARAALRAGYSQSEPRRRVFLARPVQSVATAGRVLTNEAELINVARKLDYEIVDPGAMTQAEQRALFTSAAVICGPTGAALTNALYLPDGARVVCLSPLETCRTYFPGLTLGQDIAFDWVLGRFDPELSASRKFPHLPYSIASEHLQEVLSR